MAKITQLKERNTGESLYPVTTFESIIKEDSTLQEELDKKVDSSHLQNITPGLNHIPDNGSVDQILTWKSKGEAQWTNLSKAIVGIEQLVAYGVEWDENVADPHLTRIGNMSFHKTLPIQSQLKGCIAQRGKIIYWLDENDWRFRKDPIKCTVSFENDVEFPSGIPNEIRANLGVNQYVKAGTHIGKIESIEGNSVYVVWEEDLGDISNELITITELEIGSRLDGFDGTVKVYCPEFYIKSEIIGTIRRVWLSLVKLDDTWTHQIELLIDAYQDTILNKVPTNMGFLSTLPINSAVSIVNTNDYCRGGQNRSSYDEYLISDVFRTDLGKAIGNIPISFFRTYSRNAGSELLSYDQYKNIFYWLYVIEYANFNCQEVYTEELTSEGYHQGGLGSGVTTWNNDNWNSYNQYTQVVPNGYLNEFGNRTAIKELIIPSTDNSTSITFYVPRWRGFDNTFGNGNTILDGIIISANQENNVWQVYTCQDSSKYTNSLTDDYKYVGDIIAQNGNIKLFNLGNSAHIFPGVIYGNNTTYKCDNEELFNTTSVLRGVTVGGNTYTSTKSGLGYFNIADDINSYWIPYGYRSVNKILG